MSMNRLKKMVAVAVAGVMVVAAAVPSFAAIISTEQGGRTNYIKTDNYKKYENYPCWIWYQGYCYYYASADNYLKNTTTPDGYTVDELGRWTVNGNPIHNGAGNYKMHTEDYNGKSDDEIWSLMKNKLISVFETTIDQGDYDGPDANGKQTHIDSYTYGYGTDLIWTDKDMSTYGGYGEIEINHNSSRFGTFVTAEIGNDWSDQETNVAKPIAKANYSQKSDIKEKTIKSIVGDKIGTELFNYIKQHADKKQLGGGYIATLDNSGELAMKWTDDGIGDGIQAATLDFSAWQNRTTDYGKRFSVDNSNGLAIHVYNN